MKKFYKVSLIVAGSLAGAGLLLCGFSFLIGGYRTITKAAHSVEVVEKFKDIAERTGIQISFPKDGFGLNLTSKEDYDLDEAIRDGELYSADKKVSSFEADRVKRMDISVGAGQLEIKENADTEEITVRHSGIGNVECELDNGTLVLDVSDYTGVVLGVGKANAISCTIEVPADYKAGEIAIDIDAGTVNLDDLQVGDFSLDMGTGQIICKNLKVREADIEVAAGECLFQGEITEQMEITCAAGQVITELTGKEEDYDYNIDCSVGNVRIGTTSFAGLAGSREMDRDAEKSITVECMAGNVEVKFEN